jgi:hypothetical protein
MRPFRFWRRMLRLQRADTTKKDAPTTNKS